ncbi:MAG: M48 family metallopeptidase [Pseudomonadota bacterium]
MRAYGLQTHIWNNAWKSVLLLAGFPVLLFMLTYGLAALYEAYAGAATSTGEAFADAGRRSVVFAPFVLIGALIWFAVAYLGHNAIIKASVGARSVSRKEEPELYNLLENLSIAAGRTMPKLAIIETDALNAFASGVDDGSYTVTVTRGLMRSLDKAELEAVLAHELTHIENRDVRLLIVAVVFVGIFAFIGELAFRSLFRGGIRLSGGSGRRGDSRGAGLLLIAALIMIAIAYGTALLIRFSLSRRREYLADAGAVDLTRNPDAMIGALVKISGRSDFNAPEDVAQMAVENTAKFAGVFATHPPTEKRIEALVAFGGGRRPVAGGPWSQ